MIWYFLIFTVVLGTLMIAYDVVHPVVAYPFALFLAFVALLVLALGGLVIAFICLLGAVVFSL